MQDRASGEVLTVAWVSREAIEETVKTGRTVFWSRSRGKLWRKGESSGNYQTVRKILFDCDMDSLVIEVDPAGPACHTGHRSCFYRALREGEVVPESPPDPVPEGDGNVLTRVYRVIQERSRLLPAGSYVASLVAGGQDRILKKVAEEAGEVLIASKNQDTGEVICEMADLWFHCLVALAFHGVPPEAVFAELERRRRPE